MALLLNLILMGVLSYGLYRYWRPVRVSLFYWPGLVLKILSGWALLALYRFHYGDGDMLGYHRRASAVADMLWQQPQAFLSKLSTIGFLSGSGTYHGYERVDFFVMLISPVYLLANSQIWIVAAWLSFISFLGMFWLCRRLNAYYPDSALAAAGAFLLWPSVLFWTGSITKEALAMPAIAILVACMLPYILGRGRSSLLQWVLALLSAWVLWRLKYYFALPLFAILAALVVAQQLTRLKLSYKLSLALLAVALLVITFLLAQLHPILYPESVLDMLLYNYKLMAGKAAADQRLHFEALQPTIWSLLYYLPKALAGGLLMPLPLVPLRLEPLPLLAGGENLLVLALLIAAFYKFYRLPRTAISLPVLGLCIYVCFLAVAMAIASPVFGSLLRYRTAYLPFAIFLLLYWLFPLNWRRVE